MTVNSQILNYIVKEESFPDKAVIIKEGSIGDWICVILEGCVKIKKNTLRGMLTVDALYEGDFVGEMAMLKQGNRIRTASAVADGQVLVGILDSVRLIQEWEIQPPVITKLISNLIQNLDESTKKAANPVVTPKQPGPDSKSDL